jgi:hypothetical protein
MSRRRRKGRGALRRRGRSRKRTRKYLEELRKKRAGYKGHNYFDADELIVGKDINKSEAPRIMGHVQHQTGT